MALNLAEIKVIVVVGSSRTDPDDDDVDVDVMSFSALDVVEINATKSLLSSVSSRTDLHDVVVVVVVVGARRS